MTERDADLHSELTYPPHNLEHLLKFRIPLPDTFPRRTHAKSGRTALSSPASHLKHLVRIHQPFGPDTRVVSGALRTISAVFAASAGLNTEQRAELHFAF